MIQHRLPLRLPLPLRLLIIGSAVLLTSLALIPCVYLIPWTIFGTENAGILGSPTTEWIAAFWNSPQWKDSVARSCLLSLVVAIVSTTLLTFYFYYTHYTTMRIQTIALVGCIFILMFPAVIYALALRGVAQFLVLPEIIWVGIGHMSLALATQFFILRIADRNVPSELIFAASTLGASHWGVMTSVYWPLMRGAVWLSFLVGFLGSYDEVVIDLYLIDSPNSTVAKKLWDESSSLTSPMPAVASFSLVLMLVALWLLRISLQRSAKCKS